MIAYWSILICSMWLKFQRISVVVRALVGWLFNFPLTSGGVRCLTYNPWYFGLSTLFPVSQSAFWMPENSAVTGGKHCTGNIPSAVYLTTACGKQMWDTCGFNTGFFHANLIRELFSGLPQQGNLNNSIRPVIFSAQGRHCIPSQSATSDKL